MQLEVILAKYTINKGGLPDEWPVLCIEVKEGHVFDDKSLKMTSDELIQYKKKHLDKYKIWSDREKNIKDVEKEEKTRDFENLKNSIKNKLSLTDKELEIIINR